MGIFLGAGKRASAASPELPLCGSNSEQTIPTLRKSAGRQGPNSDVSSKRPTTNGRTRKLGPLLTFSGASRWRPRSKRNGPSRPIRTGHQPLVCATSRRCRGNPTACRGLPTPPYATTLEYRRPANRPYTSHDRQQLPPGNLLHSAHHPGDRRQI